MWPKRCLEEEKGRWDPRPTRVRYFRALISYVSSLLAKMFLNAFDVIAGWLINANTQAGELIDARGREVTKSISPTSPTLSNSAL